jgi:cellulose synthase/poly-beta-1,6-N-acetylglucosamine synthase-like glycosyltransferase
MLIIPRNFVDPNPYDRYWANPIAGPIPWVKPQNTSRLIRTRSSHYVLVMLKLFLVPKTIKSAINLTVLIPAYNEENSIRDTVESLKGQTTPPKEIIVIDDCSTDNTFKVAKKLGITVMQPPQNTGTKAGAQNYALQFVKTKYTMAIDADTTLAPDAIEKLMPAMNDTKIVAACGFVLPRFVKTIWERGRYIEYLLAFTFYKPIQDYYGKPLISSGCFSVYQTKVLKQVGGWPTRTMAEDMDLTWTFYSQGYGVRFIPEAVSYPIEPHNFNFMRKQLKRWSHGFVQNVKFHWKNVMSIQFLNSIIAVTLWDSVIATLMYLFGFPILAIIFQNPAFLLGYVIDAPVVLLPILMKATKRKEILQAIASYPSFFVLRFVNSFFMLEALWSEVILNKRLTTYEKGH